MGSYQHSKSEWALYRAEPRLLAGLYVTREAAQRRAEELGPGYIIEHVGAAAPGRAPVKRTVPRERSAGTTDDILGSGLADLPKFVA